MDGGDARAAVVAGVLKGILGLFFFLESQKGSRETEFFPSLENPEKKLKTSKTSKKKEKPLPRASRPRG